MESKGRKGQCLYNKKWERDPQYKGWVSALKADKWEALCQWCDRTIDISSMGESALKSRSKSEKHKQNSWCEQRVTLSSFGFGSSAGTSTCPSRNKLKFQTGKAKRIDTIQKFSEVCDVISCTTLMVVSCLYCTFLCRTSHIKSHLNWGVDYMYVKLSGNNSLKKCDLSLKSPWKVLEKKGLRSVWTMLQQLQQSSFSLQKGPYWSFEVIKPGKQTIFQIFLMWIFSSTQSTQTFSPTCRMACAISHVILVSQSYYWVNDLGRKIPTTSLLFVWHAGRSSQKRFARCCHKENFQGKVSIYIAANFRSLPSEDHRWVMVTRILRSNPIYGHLIKILHKFQNKEATHMEIDKDLIFLLWNTLEHSASRRHEKLQFV